MTGETKVREILGVWSWNSNPMRIIVTDEGDRIELQAGSGGAICHLRAADARTLSRHLNRLTKRIETRAAPKERK